MLFGPLHDQTFCEELLSTLDSGKHSVHTAPRIRGMVTTAMDELEAPFYFHPAKIAGLFHCASPSLSNVVYVYKANMQQWSTECRLPGVTLPLYSRLRKDGRYAGGCVRYVPNMDSQEPSAS